MDHQIDNKDGLTEAEKNFLEARANAILNKIKALPNFQKLTGDFGLGAEEILGEGATLNHIRQYWDNAIEHGPKGPNGKCDWEAILKNLNEIFGHVGRMLSKIKTLPLDTIPLCFNAEKHYADKEGNNALSNTLTEAQKLCHILINDSNLRPKLEEKRKMYLDAGEITDEVTAERQRLTGILN